MNPQNAALLPRSVFGMAIAQLRAALTALESRPDATPELIDAWKKAIEETEKWSRA